MAQDTPPDDSGNLLDKIKSGRAPLPVIGGLLALVVIGIIFVAVALGGGGGDDNKSASASPTSSHAGLLTAEPTVEATIDLTQPTPTAPAQNLTAVGAGDRLIIDKFGVNAPLTYRQVGLDGVMPNPAGPDDVAYYDFSAWPGKGGAPGLGGNSVFAGHVDSGSKACANGTKPPPCEAVLWDLNGLKVGDEIKVQIGGQTYTYSVVSNAPVNAASGPWDQIVSSTSTESITIITCGGDFNRETHEYNNRQVLRAERKT
ncbi:MAG TPA: class F sortase [Dehalococcoidia bacterium]|jgi:LPXTG-site transpeptidase (sortase) family protein|nr:class F sortase [Dehalococcoidia bacterium]